MDLMISQAQGDDNQAKIDEETIKLNNNIATDKKNAGAASQSVTFNG
jgi:predicted secreted protein